MRLELTWLFLFLSSYISLYRLLRNDAYSLLSPRAYVNFFPFFYFLGWYFMFIILLLYGSSIKSETKQKNVPKRDNCWLVLVSIHFISVHDHSAQCVLTICFPYQKMQCNAARQEKRLQRKFFSVVKN